MARVGTAYLQIVASLRGVRKQIRDELKDETLTIKIAPELRGLRTKIKEELKEPFTIRLDPQLRGLRTAINRELRDPFTIRLDPQLRGLRTAIQTELRREDFKITVVPTLDTFAFRAQMAALTRGQTVTINTRTTGGGGAVGGFRRIARGADDATSAFGRLTSAWGRMEATFRRQLVFAGVAGQMLQAANLAAILVGGFMAVVTAAGALGAAFNLVGQAGIALAGALALIPAALGAVLAGIAVLGLGLNGVFQAIGSGWEASNVSASRGAQAQRAAAERITDAQTAVSRAVEQRNRSVADAERGLAQAQQAVGQAIENRNRSVADSTRGLQRAQEAARTAQEALTRARETARERLEDLRLELSGTALSEERAVLQLERARERLQNLEPGASALDRREAQLAVREAEQGLAEVRERYIDVQQESAKANREGVEGSREVVEAQRDVRDSTEAIAVAQQALQRDRIDGARAIAEANRGVAEAQIQLQRAQADGAIAIAEAQRNLTNAQLQQADTVQTELRNFREEMARLSPAAQALVNTVLGLKPAFDGLRLEVQERLLAGVAGHFRTLADLYLPTLRLYLGLIADSFNRAFVEAAKFFEQTDTQARFAAAMSNIQITLDTIARTLDPINRAIFTLFVTGSKYLQPLAGYFEDLATRFNDFLTAADRSGALDAFFQAATANLLTIFKIVEDLAVIVGQFFAAANTAGAGFLTTIQQLTGELRAFFKSAEGQEALKTFFTTLSDTMKNLAPGIKAIFLAIGDFLARIGPRLPEVAASLSRLLEKLAPILVDVAVDVFNAFADFLDWLSRLPPDQLELLTKMFLAVWALTLIAPLFTTLFTIISVVVNILTALGTAGSIVAFIIGTVLTAAIIFGGDTIRNLSDPLQAIWRDMQHTAWVAGQLAEDIKRFFKDFVDNTIFLLDFWGLDLTSFFTDFYNNILFLTNEWGPKIHAAWQWIVDGLGRIFGGVIGAFTVPINWLIDNAWNGAFRGLWDAVNKGLNGALGAFPAANRIGAQQMPHNPRGASTFGLAEGGVLPGYAPGRDSIMAMLSPGEAVMRPEWARAIGAAEIRRMNWIARRWGPNAVKQYLYGGDVDNPGLLSSRHRRNPPGFSAGGPVDDVALRKGQLFAQSMAGTPYRLGGMGPGGIDCSGFMAAITNVLLGRPAFSGRFATGMFSPGRGVWGFTPGLTSAFTIGVRNGFPVGHMAGTLGGMNVESASGKGAVVGTRAWGSTNPYFPMQFSLPQVGGVFVGGPGGGAGIDIGAMVAGWFSQFIDPVKRQIDALFGNGTGVAQIPGAALGVFTKKATEFIIGKASEIFGAFLGDGGVAAGAGPVMDQVRQAAKAMGWDVGAQWDAIVRLVQKESGWRPTAQNPISTAYGLFQFLNATWGNYGIAKTSNPLQQGVAGMRYIKARYGDPLNALRFHNANNWYDNGGMLPPGLSLAYNGTQKPERVLTDEQWRSLSAAAQGGDFRITSGEIEIVGDGIARIVDARLQRVGTAIDTGRRV